MRSILAGYLTGAVLQGGLGQDADTATEIIHTFVFVNYFMPLLGAWLSDKFIGRYHTILWVSLFYCAGHGVLACSDFPTCQGAWWPAMDFEHGFAVQRELGAGKDGGYLPFAALTAIHFVHRLGALVVLAALAGGRQAHAQTEARLAELARGVAEGREFMQALDLALARAQFIDGRHRQHRQAGTSGQLQRTPALRG